MAGRLQNEDFKTKAELIAAGGASSQLLNDTKVYVTGNGINDTLDQAILSGQLGGGGGKNYLANPKFTISTGGIPDSWAVFKTTLTSKIPTGSIGAADAGFSITQTSSSPLEGTYSGSLASTGVLAAGNGLISAAFTIDLEDQAKVMGFSFYYQASVGTMDFSGTSSNTWAAYIYDVTNSAWIQPAGVYNLTQSSGVGLCSGTFQTTSNSTQYRIALVCITATVGAVTLKVDDAALGPQKVVYGPAMSDWVAYTPAVTGWTTNFTATGFWRRNGDSVEVMYNIALTGAPTGTLTSVGLPSGMVIDTAKLTTVSAAQRHYGFGGIKAAGTSDYISTVSYFNTTSVRPFAFSLATSVTQNITATVPGTFANGDYVQGIFKMPISGWSSNTVQSSDTDTRVVAFKVYATANTSIPTATETALTFDAAAVLDTHAAWNGSDTYVAPVSGYFEISISNCSFAANATGGRYVVVSNNGSTPNPNILDRTLTPSGTTLTYLTGSTTIYANAGAAIQVKAQQTSGGNLNVGATANLSIRRLSGPATIAASETVAAFYQTNAGNQLTDATSMYVDFEDKVFDTHSAVTLSSSTPLKNSTSSATGWKFTAPISGKYLVACTISLSTAVSTSTRSYFQITKNASTQFYSNMHNAITTSGNSNVFISGSAIIDCLAGDTLQIFGIQGSGADRNMNNGIGQNSVSITRIGN